MDEAGGKVFSMRYDNDGKGFTRTEAMKICSKLAGEGKYCGAYPLRKGGE